MLSSQSKQALFLTTLKTRSMAKYHLHDTTLSGLLTSRSWVIYYKQLNVQEATSLHQRSASALLLKRWKERLPLWWIVYSFERLFSKETVAPTHVLPSEAIISMFVRVFVRVKLNFKSPIVYNIIIIVMHFHQMAREYNVAKEHLTL